MEIEKKFLLNKKIDDTARYNYNIIEQAYISTFPVIRVRKKEKHIDGSSSTAFILTVKSSGMLSRQEYEMDITNEEYEHLLTKASGNIITKKRILIPLTNIDKQASSMLGDIADSLTVELDYFMRDFSGLVMAEVEFPSEEIANKYNPAEDIFHEVTFDKRFHNSNMSSMSKADIEQFISSLN